MDIRELLRRITEFLRSFFHMRGQIREPRRESSAALLEVRPISGRVQNINEEARPVKLRLEVEVRNASEPFTAGEAAAGGVAATIDSATTLLSYMGGWVLSATKHAPVSDFFSVPAILPPRAISTGEREFSDSLSGVAATHVVYAVSASGSARPRQDLLVSAPIKITAATNWPGRPPQVSSAAQLDMPGTEVAPPVYIGLMGPLEVFDVSTVDAAGTVTTQPFLMITGQIVNPYSRSISVSALTLHLAAPGGRQQVSDCAIHMGGNLPTSGELVVSLTRTDIVVGRFHFAEPLPAWANPLVGPTDVIVEMTCTVDGNAIPTVTRTAPVVAVTAPLLSAPVRTPSNRPNSVYMWNNGPAAQSLSGHGSDPHTRYVYDLGFRDGIEFNRDAAGNPLDGSQHTNFLIWNRTLHAMADGTVVFVRKGETDINRGDIAATPGGNLLIIRHDNILRNSMPHFSLYAHMAKNTCPFIGDGTETVNEGDVVGRIGSSGNTGGGPHLHFSFYTLERGRPLMVAPRFKNLVAPGTGTAIPGVLRSGTWAQAT